jgi:hypothetical protein
LPSNAARSDSLLLPLGDRFSVPRSIYLAGGVDLDIVMLFPLD